MHPLGVGRKFSGSVHVKLEGTTMAEYQTIKSQTGNTARLGPGYDADGIHNSTDETASIRPLCR